MGAISRSFSFVRESLRSQIRGAHTEDLQAAQRDVILQRVIILVWVAAFMIPFTVFLLVGFSAPKHLGAAAFTIVVTAEVAVFVIGALVKHGVFDRHYHLAVFLLVGGIFGPVASSVCELVQADGATFFFSYFLICLAFVSLFPMEVTWVLALSFALIGSYASAAIFRTRTLSEGTLTTNLLYMIDVTVLNIVFNRVVSTMFFDERRARVELRQARDALLGEMEVAQEIQTLLLPRDATLPGHEIRGVMLPADEVGGDYYDVVQTGTGRRFFAIGDVSGHGVTSGLTMMMARSSLLGSLEADPDATLEELFASLNTALRKNLERMRLRLFMTFLLIEDLGEGRYRAIGSHLPVMVWRTESRTIEEIDVPGVWLGLLDHLPPGVAKGHDIALAIGDHLLLYTDGIIESMKDNEMFGFERLKAAFARTADRGPKAVVSAILHEVERFGGDRSDDRTILALHYTGVSPQIVSKVA